MLSKIVVRIQMFAFFDNGLVCNDEVFKRTIVILRVLVIVVLFGLVVDEVYLQTRLWSQQRCPTNTGRPVRAQLVLTLPKCCRLGTVVITGCHLFTVSRQTTKVVQIQ